MFRFGGKDEIKRPPTDRASVSAVAAAVARGPRSGWAWPVPVTSRCGFKALSRGRCAQAAVAARWRPAGRLARQLSWPARRGAGTARLTQDNPAGVPEPAISRPSPCLYWETPPYHGEPLDRDGAHRLLLLAPLSGPARRRHRAGLGWEDLPPLSPQVQGVCPEHPHQRLQHREDPGAPRGVPWHHLPSVGRRGSGEAAPAVALLHAPDRRAGVCGGCCGDREAGGGQGGAAPHQPGLGQPGCARAGAGQQAGPAGRPERGRGGEEAGGPRAGGCHAHARTGLQRRGRAWPAAGPRAPVRDDPQEEEGGPGRQEETVTRGCPPPT